MKAIKIPGLLATLALSLMLPQIATAQDKSDSTGLPGDNFSLEGALEMFKTASNLEDFEKKLNDRSSNVNNLDLNNDGKVDYVKVTDKVSKGVHAIILRINVNAKESQDVAVIAVEKDGDNSAVAQIIGDEELYGKDKVVEPIGNGETKAGTKGSGPYAPEVKPVFVVVNVWYWPCVQYIYMPDYVAWNSPWYWGYYPSYWDPWPPYAWYYHYDHCAHYRYHHHVVYTHRVDYGPAYRPHRQHSPTVHNNYRAARQSSQGTGRNAAQPAGRRSEVEREHSRPVEGTQGIEKPRERREIERPAQRQQNPVARPVERERRNAEPAQRQRNERMNPPQRSNPQVEPRQPRSNPQMNSPRSNPQIRTQPSPQRSVPQGGGNRRR